MKSKLKLDIPTEEEGLRRLAALREQLTRLRAGHVEPKAPKAEPTKEETMPEPVQTQECSRCKREVPRADFPLHRLSEDVADLHDKLEATRDGVVTAVNDAAAELRGALPQTQDIGAALAPVLKALNGLDSAPAPDDVKEHIKTCKGCEAKWGPIFAASKVEADPAPAPKSQPAAEPASAPAAPKRKVFDWVPTPLKLRAYGIQAVPSEGGAILRVPEQKAQTVEEQKVVPGCRWVKDPDGWHYACEEA